MKDGLTWYHITISQLEDPTRNDNYKLSVRVNGDLVQAPIDNNIGNQNNLEVYGSSHDWESVATAYHIDQHKLYNLRIIKARNRKCIFKTLQ